MNAERIEEMKAILLELSSDIHGKPGGYIIVNDGTRKFQHECTYCGDVWAHKESEHHDHNCPIARARALLAQEEAA